MIPFTILAVLVLAASARLVLAGREFLRVNEYPRVRMRSLADLLHLMSLGYSALNEKSAEAARRRITSPCW